MHIVLYRRTNAQLHRQLQKLNEQLHTQNQQHEGEMQNLNALVNNLAQGIQATQAAINQLLANQTENQGANVENGQDGQQSIYPPNPLEVPVVPVHNRPMMVVALPIIVENNQRTTYTFEKFIKNGAKVYKGTTDLEKAEEPNLKPFFHLQKEWLARGEAGKCINQRPG